MLSVCVDVLLSVDVSDSRAFVLLNKWQTVSRPQGTFFRIYYPCQETEKAERPDWVPCKEYFNGLADFMKINRTLSERIFNYLFGNLTLVSNMQII